LVALDFSDHARFVPITNNPRAQGALPPGTHEDSRWADVWISYTPMTDDLGGGLRWLRAAVTRHTSGAAQLKCVLPPLTNPASYRLTLVAASPGAAPLTLKIMQRGAPYHTFWSHRIMLGRERAQHVCDFTLGAVTTPVSFIISLGTSGIFDLYALELVRHTDDDLLSDLAQRYPRGIPANLLRATQFSLGWQSGWSMGVNCSLEHDLHVRPRPGVATGRTTVPVHVRTRSSRGELALLSAPFDVPHSAQAHTFSCYVRGICTGTVAVLGDGVERARQEIAVNATQSFVRIVVPFQPARFGQFHIVRMNLRGDFLLDALMVNQGAAPSNFAFGYGAEIALAQNWRRLNTLFLDEYTNQQVRYDIRGTWPPGATLAFSVHNAYGDTRALPSIPLPAGTDVVAGALPVVPASVTRPLGAQRLAARLVSPGGASLGPAQEIVYHILPRPRYWGTDAPLASPFGVHCNVFEPHVIAAKSLGANWVRTHGPNGFLTYWSTAERQPGVFTFQDAYVQIMRRGRLRILGVLTECPRWARIERPQAGAWRDNWWQPRDYGEFSNYSARIAAHFAGVIDHWEIWNEPWGGFWFKVWDPAKTGNERWQPGPDPLGDYLRLSAMAYTAAKRANPRAVLLGIGGTAWGGGHGGTWLAEMLDAGGMAGCDAPCYHIYHNNSGFFGCVLDLRGFWYSNLIHSIIAPLRATPAARSRELWMTEGKSSEHQRDTALYDDTVLRRPDNVALVRDNAALLPLFHAVLLAEGTDKVFLYNMEATGFKPVTGTDWSVLTTKSGELNVSASAYAAMTWLLEDTRFARRLALRDGVHAFVFAARPGATRRTRVTVLLAAENGRPPVIPPAIAGACYYDIFGNQTPPGVHTAGRVAYIVADGLSVSNVIAALQP